MKYTNRYGIEEWDYPPDRIAPTVPCWFCREEGDEAN